MSNISRLIGQRHNGSDSGRRAQDTLTQGAKAQKEAVSGLPQGQEAQEAGKAWTATCTDTS